ncbi:MULTISPECIES: hypothetical protein [Prochlorococcus]|uniref:hypothetical protein n=1 Tax=Prochlorococcus TaxID=1218 RepID=UPI000A6D7B97|nr:MULTISPECIES: hypothetical protein [Prochlorococcus]NMO85381.1 hypothetical protein [Prochlorococcus sp. P1344]NMP06825.1 hypothetical protein [Prochlorococcus sp. P1361]NMP13840.1 hypothetical protein [Prochlorococcus sp.P1363]
MPSARFRLLLICFGNSEVTLPEIGMRRMLRELPLSPKEEVLMSSSCSMQGLLIAENAG